MIENLSDSADSFTFARATDRRNYELQDAATEFGEFARNRPTTSIAESLKLFRQESSASTSKLAQLAKLLREANLIPNPSRGGTAAQLNNPSILASAPAYDASYREQTARFDASLKKARALY